MRSKTMVYLMAFTGDVPVDSPKECAAPSLDSPLLLGPAGGAAGLASVREEKLIRQSSVYEEVEHCGKSKYTGIIAFFSSITKHVKVF